MSYKKLINEVKNVYRIIQLDEQVVSKEAVTAYIIKKGGNKEDTTKQVEKYYDYATKAFDYMKSVKQKADIITRLASLEKTTRSGGLKEEFELDEMMVGMMISAKDATKEVFNTWAKSDMAPDKLDKIISAVAKKNKVDEKKLRQAVYAVMDKAVNS